METTRFPNYVPVYATEKQTKIELGRLRSERDSIYQNTTVFKAVESASIGRGLHYHLQKMISVLERDLEYFEEINNGLELACG